MLECACRLEGKGALLFKGDGPTDRGVYGCYYSSLRSISIVSEYLRGGGRLVLRRKAEKHLPWLFVQPRGGRWNFFLDTAGVCLASCSVCGARVGSGLAQRGSDSCKETGMAYSGPARREMPCLRCVQQPLSEINGQKWGALRHPRRPPLLSPPAACRLARLALWNNLAKHKKIPNLGKSHSITGFREGSRSRRSACPALGTLPQSNQFIEWMIRRPWSVLGRGVAPPYILLVRGLGAV